MSVVIFTKHVRVRLKERGIPIDLVKRVLKNPEKISMAEENKFVYIGRSNDRTLRVITVKEKYKIIVVTAYYED